MPRNQCIVLASRPQGRATAENFQLLAADTPEPADGQVLVRHHYLSLDPYMRGRMNAGASYAPAQELGAVMLGATVGEVVASRHPEYRQGDKVLGMGGWQEYGLADGNAPGALRKIAADALPLSWHLGALGMPGVTAWYGLNRIIAPKAGDTLSVSAATGAVGSAFAALAKARGCRVVGFAGGARKCHHALEELGFDACIDHRAHDGDAKALAQALKAASPDGVDGGFENVGGALLDAVLQRMNPFGRIALCGMIAGYDGAPLPMANPALLLVKRLRIEGFIVSEHPDVWPAALAELRALVASGKLRPRETIAHGLAAAPQAFLGLLQGRNLGKQLVQLI